MSIISARTKRIMSNISKEKRKCQAPVFPDPVVSDTIESELFVTDPVVPDPVAFEPAIPVSVLPDSIVSEPVLLDLVLPDPVLPDPIVSEPIETEPLVAEIVALDTIVPVTNTLRPDLVNLNNPINLWRENDLVFKVAENMIINNDVIMEHYIVSTENGVLQHELNRTDLEDMKICSSLTSNKEKCYVHLENMSHSSRRQSTNSVGKHILKDATENYDDVDQGNLNETNSKDPDHVPSNETTEDIICTQGKLLDSKSNQKKKLSVSQKRKLAQARRVRGKSYEGYKRSKEKIVSNIPRNNRYIKARCSHATKQKLHENSFLCFNISEDERKEIFSKFWKLASWGEKKVFVTSCVTTRAIRRRRKNVLDQVKHKKPLGHDYFLPKSNDNRIKVCRKMFLNTLSLGEDSLKRWIKQETIDSDFSESDETLQTSIQSSRINLKKPQSDKRLRKEELRLTVMQWLDLIPKVPSHYCRASTSRSYVDNSFVSKQNMYNRFVEWCSENEKKATHLKDFKLVLEEKKISIHQPRKDQCDTCVGYKLGTVSLNDYTSHRQKQEAGRKAKAKMKELGSETTLVITMDLQSVLTCPKLLASESYYKLKLQVHNFTIYSLNDKKVTLYVWHEANGGVSSNEFTSCVIDYLSNELKNNFKNFILISDGCNYQNRNKILASALNDFSKENDVKIQQLYLEKGHTMMEADSVHSALEHYFYEPINSPTDYIARMRMARPSNPYNVKVVDFTFFKKYELPSNFRSIRPGKRVRDPVVVDIRQLKYLPNGEVFYTLDYTDIWQNLPCKRELQSLSSYPALHKHQLPISDEKFEHLQQLKGVIEVDHLPFYDNLPHQPKPKKKQKEKFND